MKKLSTNHTGLPEDEKGFLLTNGERFIYNSPFRILGAQMIDIDNKIIGAWRIGITDENGDLVIFKGIKTFGQWKKKRQEISNYYVKLFQNLKVKVYPKDAVRIIVKHLFDLSEFVVRL